MIWRTWTRGAQNPPPATSPALLFAKWQAWDWSPEHRDGPAKRTEARLDALLDLASRINCVVRSPDSGYRDWFAHHRSSLSALGCAGLEATTVWRLVSGFATNPAHETGIDLHHLHGVPYVPGSGVKGLVHHTAEMVLLEDDPVAGWAGALPDGSEGAPVSAAPPPAGDLESFLTKLEEIRRLLGSLTLDRIAPARRGLPEIGPVAPRTLLRAWRASGALTEEDRTRVDLLLDQPTGGRLCFYDALPLPGQNEVVQVDVLTPHYPDYYRDATAAEQAELTGGRVRAVRPPSDDQDPTPVPFLAAAPGTRFLFPYRVRPVWEDSEVTPDDLADLEAARAWLTAGLTERGIGAKTTAGYGYFDGPRPVDLDEATASSARS